MRFRTVDGYRHVSSYSSKMSPFKTKKDKPLEDDGLWTRATSASILLSSNGRKLWVLLLDWFNIFRSLLKFSPAEMWNTFRIFIFPYKSGSSIENEEKQQIMEWVKKMVPEVVLSKSSSPWKDGILLCAVIDSVVRGSCPRYDLLNPAERLRNWKFALQLFEKYVGLKPFVTAEELCRHPTNSEHKILMLLSQLKLASKKLNLKNVCGNDPLKLNPVTTIATEYGCIAKGMGLFLAVRGRRARFNLYMNSKTQLNLTIEIQGPNDTICQERISVLPQSESSNLCNVIKYGGSGAPHICVHKKIPFECEMKPGRVSVSYIPLTDGKHNLNIILQGQHIIGSPYVVQVDRSINVPEDSVNFTINHQKRLQFSKSSFSESFSSVAHDLNGEIQEVRFIEHLNKTGIVVGKKILRYIVTIDGKDVIVENLQDLHKAIADLNADSVYDSSMENGFHRSSCKVLSNLRYNRLYADKNEEQELLKKCEEKLDMTVVSSGEKPEKLKTQQVMYNSFDGSALSSDIHPRVSMSSEEGSQKLNAELTTSNSSENLTLEQDTIETEFLSSKERSFTPPICEQIINSSSEGFPLKYSEFEEDRLPFPKEVFNNKFIIDEFSGNPVLSRHSSFKEVFLSSKKESQKRNAEPIRDRITEDPFLLRQKAYEEIFSSVKEEIEKPGVESSIHHPYKDLMLSRSLSEGTLVSSKEEFQNLSAKTIKNYPSEDFTFTYDIFGDVFLPSKKEDGEKLDVEPITHHRPEGFVLSSSLSGEIFQSFEEELQNMSSELIMNNPSEGSILKQDITVDFPPSKVEEKKFGIEQMAYNPYGFRLKHKYNENYSTSEKDNGHNSSIPRDKNGYEEGLRSKLSDIFIVGSDYNHKTVNDDCEKCVKDEAHCLQTNMNENGKSNCESSIDIPHHEDELKSIPVSSLSSLSSSSLDGKIELLLEESSDVMKHPKKDDDDNSNLNDVQVLEFSCGNKEYFVNNSLRPEIFTKNKILERSQDITMRYPQQKLPFQEELCLKNQQSCVKSIHSLPLDDQLTSFQIDDKNNYERESIHKDEHRLSNKVRGSRVSYLTCSTFSIIEDEKPEYAIHNSEDVMNTPTSEFPYSDVPFQDHLNLVPAIFDTKKIDKNQNKNTALTYLVSDENMSSLSTEDDNLSLNNKYLLDGTRNFCSISQNVSNDSSTSADIISLDETGGDWSSSPIEMISIENQIEGLTTSDEESSSIACIKNFESPFRLQEDISFSSNFSSFESDQNWEEDSLDGMAKSQTSLDTHSNDYSKKCAKLDDNAKNQEDTDWGQANQYLEMRTVSRRSEKRSSWIDLNVLPLIRESSAEDFLDAENVKHLQSISKHQKGESSVKNSYVSIQQVKLFKNTSDEFLLDEAPMLSPQALISQKKFTDKMTFFETLFKEPNEHESSSNNTTTDKFARISSAISRRVQLFENSREEGTRETKAKSTIDLNAIKQRKRFWEDFP